MANYDPANPFKDKTAGQGGSPYDYMRQKATQDSSTGQAQAMEALTRRQAAQGSGNMNNGSYIKGVEEVQRQGQQANQDAQGQINMAEMQGALPYKQMEQQEGQFGRQLGQQESQFSREMPLKTRQLDLEERQQNLDSHANDINARLAEFQANHSGGLFGGGGILGFGIGDSVNNSGFGSFHT